MNTQEYISSGIIEAYLLGTATQDEAGILECVMSHNAEVRAAFEEAQVALENLASVQAVAPEPELKNKIWTKISESNKQNFDISQEIIQSERIENEPEHVIEVDEPQRSTWNTWAIAASILLLLSIGGNIFYFSHSKQKENQIVALNAQQEDTEKKIRTINEKLSLVANPDLQKIVLAGVGAHPDSKAVVFWNKTNNKVYLSVQNLPEAPSGMQYQLWAIAEGKPVNAGMYSKDKDMKMSLAEIPEAQAFAITLEKEGGSPVPTMENMYVMGTVL